MPLGHRSNGPATVISWIGVRWVLPIQAVPYPLSRRISSTVAALRGMLPL